ncbi:hypothetical protein Rain11_1879 [Raineya orbicola]|jgi:hypothetical protein|uniref:Uncharacterized protein n=1 Tax=Raineya orbicola TaxID=2016530 RepID=A0A2N3IC08_9BACT|nr:hypothetical protein Rain11_1879 [Raineya orbicola]
MKRLALNSIKLVDAFVSIYDFLKEFNPILQAHLVRKQMDNNCKK